MRQRIPIDAHSLPLESERVSKVRRLPLILDPQRSNSGVTPAGELARAQRIVHSTRLRGTFLALGSAEGEREGEDEVEGGSYIFSCCRRSIDNLFAAACEVIF